MAGRTLLQPFACHQTLIAQSMATKQVVRFHSGARCSEPSRRCLELGRPRARLRAVRDEPRTEPEHELRTENRAE
jgi:hypothetical protein